MKKLQSIGYINADSRSKPAFSGKETLYSEERKILKEEFDKLGSEAVWDWTDPAIMAKLKAFARQIITVTTDVINQTELVSTVLPTETINPGDTFVWHEISGPAVYYGTYGAAIRMSRPQFEKFTATTNLKEIGIRMLLSHIQNGKYSPSELADYAGKLVTAWRNRLLFVTTLAGNPIYQASGAQYRAGTSLDEADMLAAFDLLTDEAEVKLIVGRRTAIHQLSTLAGFSSAGPSERAKEQFEGGGMVSSYAGVPIVKVNSFTDNDYGVVYPFPQDELWIFSELPAGRFVQAGALRTADETILRDETLNLYLRWDDGIGIFKTDRIVRVAAIT